ncbi:helix-turn-helix transcriptional regulator [Lacticaseibacillus pabuli]|uniref:Helix-turn-helix transcriptional regulator n=1 Tax=Lacticaseibacillus pabuli TaxID=3025672 RepID=A0ABY7WTS9_9LACO|nr:helix-turn-helix transcriptional regulator [Lacticaseibacillus sp. KACC 23028]WDF83564.1 helix-turn-helix transcriptional regulator [Lacticaseibacillus sp. KACC 23028]
MLPERLKELRLAKHLTQEDVANFLGITRPAYTAYESGKRQPDDSTKMKLAQYYSVTVDYLLGVNKTPAWATQQQVTDLKTWLDDPAAMDGFSFGGAELTEDEKDKLKMSMTQIFWNRLNLKRMPINKDEGGDNK